MTSRKETRDGNDGPNLIIIKSTCLLFGSVL